jgi:O-acetyl-ADP-ribose deacetylase
MSNFEYPNLSTLVPLELHNVSIYKGDITELKVDAIVNASNENLTGCGVKGHCIDAAIHIAAGSKLLEHTKEKFPNGCATGEAIITPGFNLKSKYIIHTTAPIYNKKIPFDDMKDYSNELKNDLIQKQNNLRNCYLNCFKLCTEHKIDSLVLCCLGTGIYGYPTIEASIIALYTTYKYLLTVYNFPKKIIFCVYTDQNYNLYKTLIPKFFKSEDTKKEKLVCEFTVILRVGMMGNMYEVNLDLTETKFSELRDLADPNDEDVYYRAAINLPSSSDHYWIELFNLTVLEGLQMYGIDPTKSKFSITLFGN